MKKWVPVGVLSFFIFLPIFLYIYKFGFGLWSSHAEWAEFGSYFSGVYSPIIAFIALFVLIGQVHSQNQMNKYQYDTTYISANKEDLNYLQDKLEDYISRSTSSNDSLSKKLIEIYYTKSVIELNNEKQEISNYITINHPKISGTWMAIYPILNGLKSNEEFPYKHNYLGCHQKITSVLTLPMCVTLDKLYYCISNNLQPEDMLFWNGK